LELASRVAVGVHGALGYVLTHQKETTVWHLLFVHRFKRIHGCIFWLLEADESVAGQDIFRVSPLDMSGQYLPKLVKHGLQLGVVSALWQILNVKVVELLLTRANGTNAVLSLLVLRNLNLLSLQLTFVALLDRIPGCLLVLELDVAEASGFSVVESLQLERVNVSVLAEVLEEVVLREFWREIANDDVSVRGE
jgi:hypothetical protein